jgi:hypothetical protein
MAKKIYNGLEIDVPKSWVDLSTLVVAPPHADGESPSIAMVVRRKPRAGAGSPQSSLNDYLAFMKDTYGALDDLWLKKLGDAEAAHFVVSAHASRLRQVTLIAHTDVEEIAATVTQRDGDPTTLAEIEEMLRSVRALAGGAR